MDAAAQKDALNVATKAMTLYARPEVDAKTWIFDLAQYMTLKAGADYQDVDPANIPAFSLAGLGKVVADPSNGYGCHVLFTTSVGVYDFQMLRQGQGQPWQVNRITPPEGIH